VGGILLARWKLFGRSKSKEEETIKEIDIPIQEPEEIEKPVEEATEDKEAVEEITEEVVEKPEETPVTEHHETLYSEGDAPKKSEETKPSEEPWKRSSWESPSAIEKNVDDIDQKKIDERRVSESGDIEDKVDRLLAKKKK
jgi:hypothetical protein